MAMMQHLIGRKFLLIALLPFLLVAEGTSAALIASVDRTILSDADLVTLSIRASDESSDVELDFSGIERDFEILDTGASSNSSISIVNGRTT
ncbi:MAG: hypothetical protein ACI8Z1_001180, partial [Candidatus Azotimanducaceae bacterium]